MDDKDEVTNRDRWHLSGAFAWALSLAALVFIAGAAAVSLRSEPSRVVGALMLVGLTAGACGIALDRRLRTARSQAVRDPLTGLPNRVLLEDRIAQALRLSQRDHSRFTLILVDLDGFKDVNDVRGHGAGDAVLRSLARRFEAIVRASDTVARVGGDEFVILSLGTGNDEQAAALVGRLRHALRRPFRVEGSTVEIDGSIGWAVFPDDGATADELLARADGQMYATKRDTSDDSLLLGRGIDAGVIRDVEAALERNELVVVYQPILAMQSGEPHSAEALVRRLLPDRTLLPPADFVPHVERTPLVRELTFLVVADAIRSTQIWAEAGSDLGVSVNVPYKLLDDPVFAEGLGQLLRPAKIAPGRLTLEVVPAGPGAGSELDEEVLGRLSELGVRLSLDDGGRAASFAALRVLPLDELKIDAGFVHGLGRSETDEALVRGLIEIARSLGLEVVAEGVETREAWNVLATWGCDYAQGFYVASPRSPEELVDWLRGRWPAVA
ncbi:MAG: putative bifunctional diguanylate cyclase/phosphodiesterase [Gaiellaceae bacterium]